MGMSAITVAALATTPGVGYIDLAWTYDDPFDGNLPPVSLDAVEVHAATTNNRALATKVVEGITSARHSGVVNGATWYYWIRARSKNGSLGEFHPSSAAAGVSGTEATATQVTLSALTAVVNVSQVSLQWVITDPSSTGLGYLGLAAVEVWAAGTNDRAGASKVTEGLTSAVHDAVPEGDTRYYWVRSRNRNGTFGSFFPSSTTAGVVATARDQVGLTYGLSNGKLVASVTGNALTVAIKTAAGNDPSASDPVFLAFQNSTQSIGSYVVRQLSSALSMTVSSGSTLGVQANNQPFRIWVVIFDDGGTLKLGVFNASIANQGVIYPLAETSQAAYVDVDSGGGTADGAGVFYTNTALSTKFYRTIGFVEYASGLATAGLWAAGPTTIRLAGRGVQLPGGLIQDVSTFVPTHGGTNASTIPFDDTTPQSSEGRPLFSVSLTPASPCNFFEIEGCCNMASSVQTEFIAALFQDVGANALQVQWDSAAANLPICLRWKFRLQAGTAVQRVYGINVGASQAGTVSYGAVAGVAKLNSALMDYFQVKELQG